MPSGQSLSPQATGQITCKVIFNSSYPTMKDVKSEGERRSVFEAARTFFFSVTMCELAVVGRSCMCGHVER